MIKKHLSTNEIESIIKDYFLLLEDGEDVRYIKWTMKNPEVDLEIYSRKED